MGWQVALTDEADADLQRIVAFLAQKSPTAAERIGLELVDLISSLDQRCPTAARQSGNIPPCASSRTAIIT